MEFSRPLDSPLIFDSFTFFLSLRSGSFYSFYWRSHFNDPVLELWYTFYTLYPDSLLAPLLIYIIHHHDSLHLDSNSFATNSMIYVIAKN